VRIALLTSLLALACASAPPPPAAPSAVPSAAVEAMCGRMRTEGMTADLRVVRMTQPIVTPAVISSLADVTFDQGKASQPVMPAGPLPVEPASCSKVTIDSINSKRDADVMVLQFSAPFSNPFSRRQLGVVARISLGDESPMWYWIPIGQRNGTWSAGRPVILAIRE
jgi:hypothetical protein